MQTLEIPMNVRVKMGKPFHKKDGQPFDIGKLTCSMKLKVPSKFIMLTHASMRLFLMAVKSLYERKGGK